MLALIGVAVLMMLSAASAQAAPPGTIESIPIPETNEPGPNGIAAGPNGFIWFTEFGRPKHGSPCPKPCPSKIGVLNPFTHEIDQYETRTPEAGPLEITLGPDRNLWFTEFNVGKIGEINPKTHAIKEFTIPTTNNEQVHPFGIASGREGDLWFTVAQSELGSSKEQTYVGEINAKTHHIDPLIKTPTEFSFPTGIRTGPEGKPWFTEGLANKIGVVNPSTDHAEDFPSTGSGPNTPGEMTLGREGNLWFTELSGSIGEINPKTHEIHEEKVPQPPSSTPLGITTGREGGIWFTELFGNNVVKFDPTTKEFSEPFEVPGAGPTGITAGKEGNLWFSEHEAGAIGTIQLPHKAARGVGLRRRRT